MCILNIQPFKPEAGGAYQLSSKESGPLIIGQDDSGLIRAFNHMGLENTGDNCRFGTSGQSTSQPTQAPGSFTHRKESTGHHTPVRLGGLNQGAYLPATLYSPSWGSSFSGYGMSSPLWSPYSPGAIGQERGSPLASLDRSEIYHHQAKLLSRTNSRQNMDFAAANHNVVDVERIRAGLDVRTTVSI